MQKFLADQELIDEQHALTLLSDIQNAFLVDDIDFSLDLAALKTKAMEKADTCKSLIDDGRLTSAQALFDYYQLGDLHYSDDQAANRLADAKFWLRRMRRKTAMLISQVERALGYVSKRRAAYCGDVSVKRRKQANAESLRFMQTSYLQNEQGFTLSLADIAEHTIANPIIRRHELMVRIRGFEEVAKLCGHSAVFITLTTPSRMHATRASGSTNDNYDGSTAQDAQAYLNHVWQLCRAKLNRDQIAPYGFRVVEPHHDGTPHWHLLLFVAPEQLPALKATITHYGLQDSPNEKGAKTYRVKCVDIDPSKGTAAGYIAKYISKNIDGFAVGTDTSGKPADQAAERINAWARANTIRQFQQIGGPSVTVWRELRRLKQCETGLADLDAAYAAADSANWAAFCLATNSVGTPKKDHLLKPMYEIKTTPVVDYQTGEIIETALNRYQEPRKASIAGFYYLAFALHTRLMRWHAVTCHATTVAAEAFATTCLPFTGRLGGADAEVASWTCVNNCTEN